MSFFFFFSSRRRHTRSYGDWSSDVCSSDLTIKLLLDTETRLPRLGIQEELDRLVGCSTGKRRLTCQQLVKYCAKSIDICDVADTRVVSHCLFWRHVTGRAQNFQRVRDGALTLDQSRQAKISEVRFAFCIQQNVSRLDVSMKDAVFMREVHSPCDLRD